MRRIPLALLCTVLLAGCASTPKPVPAPAPDPVVTRILDAALADSSAYALLEELCDTVGPRLSGTEGYARAVDWGLRRLEQGGLDDVRAEPVLTPHWVRGEESCALLEPFASSLSMIGLGGSVGTPPEGIEAEVLVVRDWDELEARSDEAAGRIVLFAPDWEGYGPTVQYRSRGAIAAAQHGAVACLVRSAGNVEDDIPHTGVMRYDDAIPKIPAAALSVVDAQMLRRQADRGLTIRVRLEMEAETLPDVESANVVADLLGRERPEEIIVVGGHLDSWDVGCCAHDDGAGCVIAMEAVRLLARLDLRPRRTLRVVLFADEEQRQTGGRAYAADHADELDRHVAAIESDSGGFPPAGFTARADSTVIERLAALAAPLAPLGAESVTAGWGGVDISFMEDAGVPLIGHRVHGAEYFSLHHSSADVIERVDPADLQRNVAVVAALLWLIGESEDTFR